MAPWDHYLESLGLLNLTWGHLVLLTVGLSVLAIAAWRGWQLHAMYPTHCHVTPVEENSVSAGLGFRVLLLGFLH